MELSVSEAAAAMGRSTSEKKAASSRANTVRAREKRWDADKILPCTCPAERDTATQGHRYKCPGYGRERRRRAAALKSQE